MCYASTARAALSALRSPSFVILICRLMCLSVTLRGVPPLASTLSALACNILSASSRYDLPGLGIGRFGLSHSSGGRVMLVSWHKQCGCGFCGTFSG